MEEHVCERGDEGVVVYELSGAWGLPSSDPFCMTARIYCSMAGVQATFVPCDNPGMSPKGQLPVLQAGRRFVPQESLVAFLEERASKPLDDGLAQAEEAEAYAFQALVEDKLHKAFLYNRWHEAENFEAVTQDLEADRLPFPLSYFLPRLQQQVTSAKLEHMDDTSAYEDADEVYTALAHRLGSRPYFYGNAPRVLDAVVLGHLLVHYYAPSTQGRLRELIARHRNLEQFVTRLAAEHLAAVPALTSASVAASRKRRETREALQRLAVAAGIAVVAAVAVRNYSTQVVI